MLGWQTIKRHYLNLTAKDGASFNWKWQRTRREFLRKVGKKCACCGGTKKIEVHHMKPRHLFPELALVENNLIALCGKGKGCHFHIGHLNSYYNYNEEIFKVAMYTMKHSVLKKNRN